MFLRLHPRRSRLPRLLVGLAVVALALAAARPGTAATSCENPSHHHAGAGTHENDEAGALGSQGGLQVHAAADHGAVAPSAAAVAPFPTHEGGDDDGCEHCPPDDCGSDPGCDATVYFAVAPRAVTMSWTASSDAGWSRASASGQVPHQPRRPPRARI